MQVFRSVVIIMCLLVCNACAYGQVSIDARVANTQHEPLPFATAILHRFPDSAVVKAELTDHAGSFHMTVPSVKSTFLEVISPGYATWFSVIEDTLSAAIRLEIILAPSGHVLKSLTVSSKRPLIEHRVDRTVFNVENSISSAGSDAFDMLAKAPGVRVVNGDITIVGKSTVSVMINDRLVKLEGSELEAMLRSMPADNVSRVEIITTPPARYDAEGNAGIINIVTKKSIREGLNGNVSATWWQRLRPSQQLTGTFNFRKSSLNLYGNGNINWFRFISPQTITTFYPGQQQDRLLDQQNNPAYNRLQVGADYNLTDRAIAGIMYTIGSTNRHNNQFYTTRFFSLPAKIGDSTMYTTAHTHETALRNVVNLNYEWKIDTAGRKLNADIDYFTRTNNTGRGFITQMFLENGNPSGAVGDNKTTGRHTIDISSAKVDITWPAEFADLAYGAKLSAIHNISDNDFAYLDGAEYVNDTTRANRFDYKEQTQAAYMSAQKKFGRFEVQAGLRGEYTQTKAVSLSLKQSTTNNYFKIFPTAYIQYTISDDHIFNLNYSRRIERPEYEALDPFRNYSTGNSYEAGNPFLQPSFVHNTELTYTFRSNYSLVLFSALTKNDFTRVVFVDSTNNSHSLVPVNAGDAVAYGLVASATVTPFKWWESLLLLYGYNDIFHPAGTGNIRYSLFAFAVEAHNDFTLNRSRTLLADLGFNYNSTQQDDYTVQYPQFNIWGGCKVLLFKKQLVIAANINDPFKTAVYNARNLYNGSIQRNYNDYRAYMLAVTWKFGNRNIKDRRERKTETEETNRAE